MDEQAFRLLNGILLLIGGFVLWSQLGWQLLLGLWGEQRRAAFAVVLATSLILIQYGLAVLKIAPSLALNERGTVTFFIWIGTVYWWSDATRRHNQHALSRMQRRVNWWYVFLSIFKKETWVRPQPPIQQFPGEGTILMSVEEREIMETFTQPKETSL